jgi:hypothetical protein
MLVSFKYKPRERTMMAKDGSTARVLSNHYEVELELFNEEGCKDTSKTPLGTFKDQILDSTVDLEFNTQSDRQGPLSKIFTWIASQAKARPQAQ